MNKKGFTLVELLAIVVLLMTIILVSVPSFISTIKKDKEITYQSAIQDIILAAESFNSVNNGLITQVSVEDLKANGFLKGDKVNPLDNSILNGCIYIVDGEYIYKEEICTTIYKKDL